MRLGFHYHVPGSISDGQIRMPGYQGRFVDALGQYCSEVVCFLHTPVGEEMGGMDYQIQEQNVRLISLGPHLSVPLRLLSARKQMAVLNKHASGLDVLLLRGPSPLLPSLAQAVRPLPTALLLVGDSLAGVDDLAQPFWRKLAIRMLWGWNSRGQARIARKALTFVNSRKLFDELRPAVPHLCETRTTTLTESDFFGREDTCFSRPCRLLYVGRLDRAKGLLDIVDAVSVLKKSGEEVVLDLVGWPAEGDRILCEIQELASRLGLSQSVIYHGRKAVGPELFGYYQRADVFVLASQSSEGFPRTVWEALAHSLPVVATRVGSIPQFVGAAAELVPPNDVQALVAGIRRVIAHRDLRQNMIRTGRKLASEVTLEKQVSRMVLRIQEWVQKQN